MKTPFKDRAGTIICVGDLIKVGQLKDTMVVVWDKEFKTYRLKRLDSEMGLGFENCKYPLKIIGKLKSINK